MPCSTDRIASCLLPGLCIVSNDLGHTKHRQQQQQQQQQDDWRQRDEDERQRPVQHSGGVTQPPVTEAQSAVTRRRLLHTDERNRQSMIQVVWARPHVMSRTCHRRRQTFTIRFRVIITAGFSKWPTNNNGTLRTAAWQTIMSVLSMSKWRRLGANMTGSLIVTSYVIYSNSNVRHETNKKCWAAGSVQGVPN